MLPARPPLPRRHKRPRPQPALRLLRVELRSRASDAAVPFKVQRPALWDHSGADILAGHGAGCHGAPVPVTVYRGARERLAIQERREGRSSCGCASEDACQLHATDWQSMANCLSPNLQFSESVSG
jgi:hypothetical protein